MLEEKQKSFAQAVNSGLVNSNLVIPSVNGLRHRL